MKPSLLLEISDIRLLSKQQQAAEVKEFVLLRMRKRSFKQITAAQQEAQNAFGNAGIYLEKFLTGMKHVEIQIIADKHGNVVHLGERDCSVQRRRQKLVEEAPCPILTDETRTADGCKLLFVQRKL